MEFAVPVNPRVKLKEGEKKDKFQDLARELKHEREGNTNFKWSPWYRHQVFGTGTGKVGIKKSSGDHPNYSITEIGQNGEKRLGDFRILAVTQNPVTNHQLK